MISTGTTMPKPETIRSAIADALHRDVAIDVDHIRVICEEDVVWLDGVVESWAAYRRAESVTRSMPGVKAVQNDLRIRCPA